MLEYLEAIIGLAPPGLEFLAYIFSFVLALIGLYFLYSIVRLFFDVITSFLGRW